MVVISIVYLEESLFILKYNVENQYQILLNEIELRKILDFFFKFKMKYDISIILKIKQEFLLKISRVLREVFLKKYHYQA